VADRADFKSKSRNSKKWITEASKSETPLDFESHDAKSSEGQSKILIGSQLRLLPPKTCKKSLEI
jgi:hypothetical protein